MKTGIVFFIFIIGVLFFGFLYTQRDEASPEPVFITKVIETISDLKQKFFSSKEDVAYTQEPIETTSRISIALPENFTMTSGRQLPSSFQLFEAEVSVVEKKDPQEGWTEQMFGVSQFLSKNDFDQALAKLLDPKSYPGMKIVSAPVENLVIDGQTANHYVLSDYGDAQSGFSDEILQNMHFVAVPSKFTIINFEHIPDFPDNVFTLPETLEIISLIKFNNGEALISMKKTPEEVTTLAELTTIPFGGISIGLPSGLSIDPKSSPESMYIEVGSLGHLILERSMTQAEWDSRLLGIVKDNGKPLEGFTFLPMYTSTIGGEVATHYDVQLTGFEMYQVVVPSKFFSIVFVTYGQDQNYTEYTIEDVKNMIASIRFNY